MAGRVAILGVGLIGGSVGLALRAAGYVVTGWDSNPDALSRALHLGCLDSIANDSIAAVADSDVVLLAVPISATIPLLESVAAAVPLDAVVTDVGSTKSTITARAEELVGSRFVGGHPMAGSERSGASASSATLFRGAAWILTPTIRTDPAAVESISRLAECCGARVRTCSPEAHDELTAALSHLPHVLAFALAQTACSAAPAGWEDAAGGSLRDGSRVAGSSPALWTEILMDNRAAILPLVDAHLAWIARFRSCLNGANGEGVAKMLSEAHESHKRLNSNEHNDSRRDTQ